jgi:GMP synthase (glutamine-hydrolysing)
MNNFITEAIKTIQTQVGDGEVVLGLSGGVDSTVVAALLQKAIGNKLYCVFVDNGLLRKNEFDAVLDQYKGMGLNVNRVEFIFCIYTLYIQAHSFILI